MSPRAAWILIVPLSSKISPAAATAPMVVSPTL
jgi:hypothetical protein